MKRAWIRPLVTLSALLTTSVAIASPTLTTLATLSSSLIEPFPEDGLVMDASGNLYGTTFLGGTTSSDYPDGSGTVFELNPNTKTLTTLAQFNGSDGSNPQTALIFGADGNLYGTTEQGGPQSPQHAFGSGTIFKLNPSTQQLTTLATFYDATGPGDPDGRLFQDSAGNLYGTTYNSGPLAHGGAVFEYSPANQSLSTLAAFDNETPSGDGAPAKGGLTSDGKGNLYGTLQSHAGTTGDGTLFVVNPNSNTNATLATFNLATTGFSPNGDMIIDSSGNLYGTCSSGGADNSGTIFKFDPSTNSLTNLASFGVNDEGDEPVGGLIADAAGNLYGTTEQGGGPQDRGTIFKYSPQTGQISTLYTFIGGDNGESPVGGLVADSSGDLFGVTSSGGTVFELSNTGFVTSVPEPSSLCLLAMGIAVGFANRRRKTDGI